MNSNEIIRERIEFLKLEYQQLKLHNDHLETAEWKVRQLSITLWLAAVAVGMGLEGVTHNNLSILFLSVLIPYMFLYMDARIGRWMSSHKARMKQIEMFLSNREYIVPSTGTKTSFAEFCSSIEKSYDFPVLDFNGKATYGEDPNYVLDTKTTFPHMIVGLRRIFYQSQILGALIVVSIQLYSIYHTFWSFLLIAIGPLVYLVLIALTKARDRNLLTSKHKRLSDKKSLQTTN